ncbi:MAG: UDP-3-O-(3-hydroxymyristoyl)glucosamine N-acyltransferase, partial [Devosia nanyangense]|nr:UDP-3-O-(3-hydroxymyristoyl)glucosamine N-acyltransferase [Devosia nanyangense]
MAATSRSVEASRSTDLLIAGADELSIAGPSELALAAHNDYAEDLRQTDAGAVVVTPALLELVPAGAIALVTE